MRVLSIGLLVLMLSGCATVSRSPATQTSNTTSDTQTTHTSALYATSVRVYSDASELVGKPFHDLGEVSGESCQFSNQDSPPSIPTARKNMQLKAAKMKANAVLVHRCEVTSGMPGCYRQAFCVGSALNIPAQ